MSDWYVAVAVRDVSSNRAELLAQSVVEALAGDGIIQSVLDPEAVLGGVGGYRPGPRIAEVYERLVTEVEFWRLVTNGMEPCIGRWVNSLGFTCLDGFTCSECNQKFAPGDDSVAGPFAGAIGEFMIGVDDPTVCCPSCGAAHSVRNWLTVPHFGFVNLAFQFWNWPPFGTSSWKVNIPAIVQEVTDHQVIVTHGRL
ncbi:hypothetical protein Pan181_38550 [Aeoliella mucimassa]|uniref:Uncharacterized protein n=1 Tax=Aeoliella mucimassa TaxID=2527972 RepID=A0A518ASF8_9BACT|nr:hypothetical protein Pan181_38550 [Aeoliella mucimassa]